MALQNAPMTPSPANTSTPLHPVIKPPAVASAKKKNLKTRISSAPFWIGLSVSLGWVGTVIGIVAKAGPAQNFIGVPLADWAIGVSAAVSPVAMVWMVTAYLQRAADIQNIAEPLRRQLTLITGESGAADARIRRFNQALREQVELLRNTQTVTQDDLESVMDRVQQHRAELERFESVSTKQATEIRDIVRRSMFQIEQMMDDKFTMLRVLDGKLQQSGDGVARQVEGVGEQISKMLEEIDQVSSHVADALDRAQRDSKKLADTSRLQESSLTNAAEAAAETLGGLSSKIDLSVAQFLERASVAREEAERLAHALDAQTRALDDFSTTLPVRVSEAEAVLRGVADRLYASEQMAREQAVHLSEKLSQQVDGLQQFMDRFTKRLTDIDGGLDKRQGELNSLGERIGATTSSFITSWEESLTSLNDRTGNTLLRFTVVNDETRRNAEAVASHLAETTGKYEDVVIRMRALSSDSSEQMKTISAEVANQLAQFEALSKASNQAGEEVQARAATALQNLQHVLERVLSARDATQAVGQTLVKDIYEAVEQNEKMITRLTETAQVGARAIASATDTLGQQQIDLSLKAQAGESTLIDAMQKLRKEAEASSGGLREQTDILMKLLAEAQSQLAATDQKLQGFATQAIVPVQKAVEHIDESAEQSMRALTEYGENVSSQVIRLQDYHARLSGMSQEMGKTTAESAATFEDLNARFSAARTTQAESARQTLAQFADMSDRLQREIGSLDGQAARAAELLQQSALKVGEQSYQMLETAKSSGAQIKDVTAALQAEAAQIQSILRQQTDEINGDLVRAEQKFSAIGETIRERADAAYAMLDRTAAHYGDVAQKIDQTVDSAQIKVDILQASLVRQAEQINTDAAKIEVHANDIATSSTRAVQNLSALNDKMSGTHDAAIAHATQTIARLDDAAGAFHRTTDRMLDTAQSATDAVVKAGAAFGEQTGKLVDGSHQVETALRQITQATTALTDQTAQIRVGMEQQNSRLLAQLADAVAQLDVTGGKLQQIVAVATQGADQASTRFADMTDTASRRIDTAAQELRGIAERTETTLSSLGSNMAQQTASLTVIGEQIGEQQRTLAASSESQRVQMMDLFEKLGGAHKQASEIAERSIAYLTSSLQEITRQMGQVGDQTQTAVGNVKMASMGFSDQALILLQNAQAAEQQTRAVLTATSALQEQARHLRESLQAESDRAGESLGSLLARLTSGGAEIRDLGTNTNAVLSTLQRAISDQANELGGSMQQIGDRQRNLTAALDQQREAINGLLNRLTLAQDETATAADRASTRLSEGAQQIAQQVEKIDTRSASALANVQAATEAFAKEAAAIDAQAKQAETQAQSILAAASGLHGKIYDLRNSMQQDGERATEVLSGLVNRVMSGSGDVRETSAAAEKSLTSLQHALGTQATELNVSMQQVGERQRALMSALAEQKETIHTLLNRFNLAQDETATASDRAAERINEGAQRIANSIDLIGAQASTTLANIQTSVTGFAEQAGALNLQSQQAEQQMRGVLSVTAGMQEQARQLREAMQVETARVIEQLTSVVGQLDTTSRQLKADSSESIAALDQTAERFTAAATTGIEMVRQQSETLAQTAEQAEARMNNAGEKVRNHLRLVGEAGDRTEAQARQLADTAEHATTRLVSLRDTLVVNDKDSREIVEIAGKRIEEVKAILQAQIQHLSASSQQAVDQVADVTQTLAAQSEVLRANLAKSESALSEAADMVREESRNLPAAINRGVADVEKAATALRAQSADVDQALIGTADRFITVTSSARNNMVGEMQKVSSVADEAGKVLQSFNQILSEQVASMQQSASLLSVEQKELVEKANHSVNALTVAGERLSTLRSEASTTAERMAHDFDTLDQRAAATSTRLVQAGEGIARQVEAITDASGRAESQMSAASNSLRDQVERIRSGLQSQIEDINRGLMQITAQLERTGVSLRSTTVGAVADVERVGQRFEQTSSEASAQVAARTEQMRHATEEVATLLSGFGAKFDTMIEQMASAGAGIKNQEGSLLTQLQGSLSYLGTVAEKLESARGMSNDISQHAIDRLDEVVNAVQAQMNNMSAGAQTAAGIMRGIGQIYSDQTNSLTKGVSDAHTQVLVMNKSIDEMQQRTDRMRAALKLQGDDLMASLRQILVQLEMTGDGLTEAVNRTLQQQGVKKIG